ncbi:hypothetical protein [Pseudomonas jinjuensis]|uniref:Uncharacterized protein n=1 Tax=Pseudomonas jinjuensis TaxID=198616 RepID=A0A1H0G8U1_9PSED|nr:hypothetical protein [Pseudomonas jinjuensis]SDO03333.1 hypothetical protein SAMN05216193_107104 [Pseudomonas jinjuensis]
MNFRHRTKQRGPEPTRELTCQQSNAQDYDEYLERKIEAGRASMKAGRGRSNEEVEAAFAFRREQALGCASAEYGHPPEAE